MPIKRFLGILGIFATLIFAQEAVETEIEASEITEQAVTEETITEEAVTEEVTAQEIVAQEPSVEEKAVEEEAVKEEETEETTVEAGTPVVRRVRGLSLAPGAHAPRESETERRATTSGNVRYGMRLTMVERDTTTPHEPLIEKRLISPEDSATLEKLLSYMATEDSGNEEDNSYDRLFAELNRAIEDTIREYTASMRTPRMIGWIGGNSYDRVDNYRETNSKGSFNANVGFGLLFPITRWFGIKGELSYMNTLYADTLIGYNRETYCILREDATLTIPLLANFMIRPRNLLFDMFAGASFMGNKKNVFSMMGTALGRRVGKNGYLFADSRFGWSTGEKFWSAGIGYEYVIPYVRDPSATRRHSIVAKPDTFNVVSRVNDIAAGRIAPSGQFRVRGGSALDFAVTPYYGYTLDSLIVNDTIMTGEIGRYSLSRLTKNLNILAMFNKIPEVVPDSFDVIIDVIDHGDFLHSSGKVRLQEGESQEFAITPKVGFVLDSVLVNGRSIGPRSSYRVERISSNINLAAYFSRVKAIEIRKIPTIHSGINFESGTANLTPDSKETLDAILAVLQNEVEMKIEIAGHTDASGNYAFNVQLSHDRAQAVVNYMVEGGISADRMRAVGFGPDKPVADNRTREGRAKNRRVEIHTINSENSENQEGVENEQ